MSISKEQRDTRIVFSWDEELRIVKARSKYDRRRVYLVAEDDDQILYEWYPANKNNEQRAMDFLLGYKMAKAVYDDGSF